MSNHPRPQIDQNYQSARKDTRGAFWNKGLPHCSQTGLVADDEWREIAPIQYLLLSYLITSLIFNPQRKYPFAHDPEWRRIGNELFLPV